MIIIFNLCLIIFTFKIIYVLFIMILKFNKNYMSLIDLLTEILKLIKYHHYHHYHLLDFPLINLMNNILSHLIQHQSRVL